MPKPSSMSKTIIARSSDSILRSVSWVSSEISSRGSFICFLRISITLVATSSIGLSHPRNHCDGPVLLGIYLNQDHYISKRGGHLSLNNREVQVRTVALAPGPCIPFVEWSPRS